MTSARRSFLSAGATVAASLMLEGCGGASAAEATPPSSQATLALLSSAQVDTSAASADLVTFMADFFTAKSNRDVDKTMSYFSPELASYLDATLGWDLAGWPALRGVFQQYMPTWPPTAKSYPTRIIGDMNGAVVCFTDSPELFGGELRVIGAVDIKDGKIVRWIDHWDGRGWPNAFSFPKLPITTYHVSEFGERASARLRSVGAALALALREGRASEAAALFSVDAVYEDMALRSQVSGRLAINRYLNRAIGSLPFGNGTALRHVVGSDSGGAFEWDCAPDTPIRTAVSAVVLDTSGAIARLTTVYDGALYSAAQLQALASQSLEP